MGKNIYLKDKRKNLKKKHFPILHDVYVKWLKSKGNTDTFRLHYIFEIILREA